MGKSSEWNIGRLFNVIQNDESKSFIPEQLKVINKGNIDQLLKNGDREESLLHFAAKKGKTQAIQQLLDKGANVSIKTNRSKVPLHYAVEENHVDAVRLLCYKGANVNATTNDITSIFGECDAIRVAALNGNAAILKILFKAGSSIDGVKIGTTPTPLYIAVEKSYHKTDDNSKKDFVKPGYIEAIKFLCDNGADINLLQGIYPLRTPLHISTIDGNIEVIQLLIDSGADVNLADGSGKTSLQLAVENNNVEVVKLLLKHGAEVNFISTIGLKNDEIRGLLTQARNFQFLFTLIQKDDFKGFTDEQIGWINKDNVNVLNNDKLGLYKLSLLFIAAQKGHIDTVKMLLDKGADLNIAYFKDKVTILHLAAINNWNINVVKLLVDRGANLFATDKYGKTALDSAIHIPNKRDANKADIVWTLFSEMMKAVIGLPGNCLDKKQKAVNQKGLELSIDGKTDLSKEIKQVRKIVTQNVGKIDKKVIEEIVNVLDKKVHPKALELLTKSLQQSNDLQSNQQQLKSRNRKAVLAGVVFAIACLVVCATLGKNIGIMAKALQSLDQRSKQNVGFKILKSGVDLLNKNMLSKGLVNGLTTLATLSLTSQSLKSNVEAKFIELDNFDKVINKMQR